MGNIRFSGALEALSKRGEKIAARHVSDSEFVKLSQAQSIIRSKTDALVSLAESKKESPSELFKLAEKLQKEFSEMKKKVVQEILIWQSTLGLNIYQHAGLSADYTTRPYSEEIRGIVRTMSPMDRIIFLQEAIDNNSLDILSAVFHHSVPPVLTGLDKKTQTELRQQFFEKVLPEYVKTMDDYLDMSDVIETSLGVGLDAAMLYSDPVRLAEIRNTEVRAETARKLLSAD